MNGVAEKSAASAPVPPVAPARTYHVQVVRDARGINELKDAWVALENAADGAILFQSFAFCRIAASHAERDGAGRFFVCCVHEGETLVGLLPLILIKKGIRTVLTGLAEPFQQFTEMLVAQGHDPAAVFSAMQPEILGAGADYLHLGAVRKTGPLFQAINNRIPAVGAVEGAPFVPLSDWPDFDTYFKTIKQKTRKNMRNARNRLERDGTIAHHAASNGPLLREVIARTYEGRVEWLGRMGLTSRAFQDAGFAAFLERFKVPEFAGIETLAMSLTFDDKPIADQWGFIHKGRYYAFISTWDTDFEEASPGKLHLGEVLKTCYEKGVEVADFMVPAVPYKATWAPQAVPVQDHVLAISPLGKIYAFWLSTLRPAAKKLAYLMPRDLRKRIFGIVFPSRNN